MTPAGYLPRSRAARTVNPVAVVVALISRTITSRLVSGCPRQLIEMWLNSPPHRENLLNPRWREIGLGGVRALGAPGIYTGYDVTILTADFGYRR